jgi:hypothetical protein
MNIEIINSNKIKCSWKQSEKALKSVEIINGAIIKLKECL